MNELIQLIAEETGHPAESIDPTTRIDSLVADSLEMLSLVTAFENRYGKFPDAWIVKIQTVNDLAQIMEAVAK